MSPKTHYSCAELAALRLPGYPGTPEGWSKQAERESWPFRKAKSKGRNGLRREYQPPAAVQKLIQRQALEAAVSQVVTSAEDLSSSALLTGGVPAAGSFYSVPVAAAPAAPVPLTTAEQTVADARAAVLALIVRLQQQAGCSQEAAMQTFVAKAALGELDADTQALLIQARDARGKKGGSLLSVRTLKRWLAEKSKGGRLAPKHVQKDHSIPAWGPAVLARYRVPQRISVAAAVKQACADLAAAGWMEADLPSEFQARRWFDKLPVSVLERGRATGAAWRAIMPCTRRDWAGLSPMDVWVGDGHTFKAKVQHPDHGRPFAPEVTLVMDCASRKVVGWAVSLSENQIAVSEALSHGFKQYGRPLIYYSDNGAGQTAKLLDAPVTGLLARLGIDHQTGIPGNPQGRGIIERVWQTLTIPLARTFPTCQTKTMDRDTLRKLTGEIDKAQRKGQVPAFVPSWKQFIDELEAAINDYNANHPHRALKGMTPDAYFNKHLPADAHLALDESELLSLYRPEVVRTPQRGEVSLFNNRYFLRELAELKPGTTVRVAFDIHDAAKVWIKDMHGRWIGEAEWEGNTKDAFPKAYTDQLKEKRVEQTVKRRQAQIQTARDELGNTLEHLGDNVLTLADFLPAQEPIAAEPEKTLLDFLPAETEETETGSYADTVMWLYGPNGGEELAEDEAAVG